ncbi:Fic family protein [Agromyces sp. NPDC057679]|uniref:Fic family protein n=1 Tax=Agromyces sp. NPDC057679 TaxID=3346207 RepID=UPI00366D2C64
MRNLVETHDWPAHEVERLPWRQVVRGGSRDDRTLDHVDASVPPMIAGLDLQAPPSLAAACERAVVEIARAEHATGGLAALGRFLMRTDSVASSRIEYEDASAEDFARALAGSRANSSAQSMVAATRALAGLVDDAGARREITCDAILEAHRRLLGDDPLDGRYAGRWRTMQNWIGGSDHAPRAALHVPPAPGRVEALMADLVAYLNRDDVPIVVQAAVGHAQFESIHPFTDGNGRIGRAIINAVLRRRGVTGTSVVPVASALLAQRERYFAFIDEYRAGRVAPFVADLAEGLRLAAEESRVSAERLIELPQAWAAAVPFRADSAGAKLIAAMLDHPVFSIDEIGRVTGSGPANLAPAVARLEAAGVIREITGRKRDRAWLVTDVSGELDDLELRIAGRIAAGDAATEDRDD